MNETDRELFEKINQIVRDVIYKENQVASDLGYNVLCTATEYLADKITEVICDTDYMANVINALEKQIPKKPFKLKDTLLRDAGWIYGCPTCKCACGENKYHYEVTVDDDYCTQCGQRLDWE